MADNIYCVLAHSGASISRDMVKPCCNLDMSAEIDWNSEHGSRLDLNNDLILQIRKELNEGVWPAACVNCKVAEEAGYNSMRTLWNNRAKEDQIELSHKQELSYADIVYLDLTIDTICNSKCMMCGPGASSLWEKEHEYIWGDDAPKYGESNIERVNLTSANLLMLATETTGLQHISFIGGEPTVSELHFEFLNMLVDNGRSKNISLSYVTNLTGINQTLLDVWSKFKNISLTVSIDGYGAVNEYIRYPIAWKKTLTTLEKASKNNMTITVSCTVSVYNCLHVIDLIKWWEQYKETLPLTHFILNRVTSSEFNNLTVLSEEYRQQGIPALQEFINENEYSYMREIAKQMIHFLLEPQVVSAEVINELKTLITRSDQFRKRSIDDFIPGLIDEVNKVCDQYKS